MGPAPSSKQPPVTPLPPAACVNPTSSRLTQPPIASSQSVALSQANSADRTRLVTAYTEASKKYGELMSTEEAQREEEDEEEEEASLIDEEAEEDMSTVSEEEAAAAAKRQTLRIPSSNGSSDDDDEEEDELGKAVREGGGMASSSGGSGAVGCLAQLEQAPSAARHSSPPRPSQQAKNTHSPPAKSPSGGGKAPKKTRV